MAMAIFFSILDVYKHLGSDIASWTDNAPKSSIALLSRTLHYLHEWGSGRHCTWVSSGNSLSFLYNCQPNLFEPSLFRVSIFLCSTPKLHTFFIIWRLIRPFVPFNFSRLGASLLWACRWQCRLLDRPSDA
jgi:hypothetical protein